GTVARAPGRPVGVRPSRTATVGARSRHTERPAGAQRLRGAVRPLLRGACPTAIGATSLVGPRSLPESPERSAAPARCAVGSGSGQTPHDLVRVLPDGSPPPGGRAPRRPRHSA